MITTVMLSDQPFHDDGTLWPLAELAEVATRFRVNPQALRNALICISLTQDALPAERAVARRTRSDVSKIATAGKLLLQRIDDATDETIDHLLILVPGAYDAQMWRNPAAQRERLGASVRMLMEAARALELRGAPSKAPTMYQPSLAEQSVVSQLAQLWWWTHNKWPNVSYRHDPTVDKGNEGARFVIAAAKLTGLELTHQRLRTILSAFPKPKAPPT
jgi:hypothetical protein